MMTMITDMKIAMANMIAMTTPATVRMTMSMSMMMLMITMLMVSTMVLTNTTMPSKISS